MTKLFPSENLCSHHHGYTSWSFVPIQGSYQFGFFISYRRTYSLVQKQVWREFLKDFSHIICLDHKTIFLC